MEANQPQRLRPQYTKKYGFALEPREFFMNPRSLNLNLNRWPDVDFDQLAF